MIKWSSNDNLDFTCEFSKMDSYCVTIISGRKSWGTISCIKCFDSIQKYLMQQIYKKFSRVFLQRKIKKRITKNKSFQGN